MTGRVLGDSREIRGDARAGGMLERVFGLSKWRTTVGTEVMAGLTTFMVMAYIIFVNPQILTSTQTAVGRAGITTATCLVAGVMTIFMGLFTNRAYALAPGLGINAIVAFQLVGAQKLTFGEAMGVIVTEGLIITLLVVVGLRKVVMDAIPGDLKKAIAVGIGFFILFIGLVDAGLVTQGQGTPLQMGRLVGWPVAVAVIGLLFTIVLMARNVRGALLWGVLGTTALAVIVNYATGGNLWLVCDPQTKACVDQGIAKLPSQWIATPDFSTLGTFSFGFVAKMGVVSAVLVVFTIMLADFFDTVGTLIGVGSEAGYLDEKGDLPDVQKPLLVDSLAAAAGGLAGASSATTYIESAAGVGVGGRTGLTAVVTGILFLLAMPFWPIVGMVPAQATAPALILVGFLMTGVLSERETTGAAGERATTAGIDFTNLAVGLPVLATMILMPLTYNITNGIGAGFILYTLIRVVKGEWRQVHPALYVVAAIFVIYFLRQALFGVTV
ncbi:MAG TPA: NCS2 family permease [Thermomicrobiales bacterium]|nr:NCS2 family permease [Thermomicrobiales bacterium]